MLLPEDIKEGFARKGLLVFSETAELQEFLRNQKWGNTNLLLMSSGNFDGINVKEFAEGLVKSE